MLYSSEYYAERGMRSFGPRGETRKAVARVPYATKHLRFHSSCNAGRSRRSMHAQCRHCRHNADWNMSESASQLSVRIARSAALDNLLFRGVARIVRSGAELWHVPISCAESSARKARTRHAHSQ